MMWFATFLITILAATPASADPISVLIVASLATVGITVTVAAVTSLLIRVAILIAFTALSRALAPKPRDPGLTTKETLTGDTNPTTFILGRSATAGARIAPPLSHGSNNAYLTYIIAVGAVSGQTLNRVVVNDEWVTLDGTPHADYGTPPTAGKYVGKLWVKFYDGTQTTADAMLVSKYGSHADYPWPSTAIGTGVSYVICTFLYDRELYSGYPRVRFELDGIPLYDIRQDSTAGGSGTQRWATPSTWAQTNNPIVMIYNLLRGVAISGGADTYGGGVDGAALPYSSWSAAMAVADATITMADASTQPAYRAGFEVRTDEEPLAIIDELLKTASADLVNSGGYWKVRAGAPASSVLSITDDDVIITADRNLDPFPGLDATHNGITARYPEPVTLYESKEAPPRYNATWETDDGSRRLVADLSLPACPYPDQAQRLMRAYIEDERRFRRHTLTLPPMATQLEPLDTLTWTSAINGYTSKLFEVAGVNDDPMTMLQLVTIRERDASDYSWTSGYELPTNPSTPSVTPITLTLTSFTATATAISDGTNNRRPAITLAWDGDQPLAYGVDWEVRLASAATIITGSTSNVAGGEQVITGGILPGIAYEARAALKADVATAWTSWTAVTTSDIRLGGSDMTITAPMVNGIVDATSFASGLQPVDVVSTLPTTGNYEGRLAVLTTDGKIYRYTSSAWSKALDGIDLITDSVLTGSISAGAVTATELAAGAATITKLGIGDFTNLNPDIDFDDAAYWGGTYTLTVTTGEITWGGKRFLSNTGASGTNKYVNGPWLPIDAGGEEFWLRVRGKTQGGTGTARVSVNYATDSTFATTVSATVLDFTTSTVTEKSAAFIIPSGYKYARLRLIKRNDGATDARFGGIEWRRKNKGELIVDGAITAPKINVTDLSAISAVLGTINVTNANIAALTVGTTEITGNAVSEIRTSSGTTPSITFTPTVSGKIVIWIWFDISTTGVGAATYILNLDVDGVVKTSGSVTRIDSSPSSSSADKQGVLIFEVPTVASASITIDTSNSGTGTTDGTKLIVFEAKK